MCVLHHECLFPHYVTCNKRLQSLVGFTALLHTPTAITYFAGTGSYFRGGECFLVFPLIPSGDSALTLISKRFYFFIAKG